MKASKYQLKHNNIKITLLHPFPSSACYIGVDEKHMEI